MRKPTFILIGGLAGSGKDTVANMILEYVNNIGTNKAKIIRFSEPVKQITSMLLGLTIDNIEVYKRKNFVIRGKTVRQWLQYIATDVFRDTVDKDIWVDILLERALSEFYSNPVDTVFIIPDYRFSNEYQKLSQFGKVKSVKIIRDVKRMSHKSENVDNLKFDIEIKNDSTLNKLNERVIQALKIIGV